MPRAETLTPALPQGFSADELAAAARWVTARIRPAASTRCIAATLEALQAVALRARRGPVCIPDLLPGSGLEVLHIPAARSGMGAPHDVRLAMARSRAASRPWRSTE